MISRTTPGGIALGGTWSLYLARQLPDFDRERNAYLDDNTDNPFALTPDNLLPTCDVQPGDDYGVATAAEPAPDEAALLRWGERKSVNVPGWWNSVAPDYVGAAFYARDVVLPADWRSRRVVLRFAGANMFTTVWLNGVCLGRHEGGFDPFEFELNARRVDERHERPLPPLRFGGTNRLWVRVFDPPREFFKGFALEETACAKEGWYYQHGGLHGNVDIYATEAAWLEDVRITPHLPACLPPESLPLPPGTNAARDATADIELGVGRARIMDTQTGATLVDAPHVAELNVNIDLYKPASEGAQRGERVSLTRDERHHAVMSTGDGTGVRFSLRQPAWRLWSSGAPNLYSLDVMLKQSGLSLDHATQRFGMRHMTLQDGAFFLNGQRIVLRGVLLQPNYPLTLANPTTPDMARQEVRQMVAGGFNLVRSHVRPAAPDYLALCDEAGLMVYQETPLGFMRANPHLPGRARREARALIRRDYNNASVVIWGLFNESHALFGQYELRQNLLRYAFRHDGSRPIFDDSGLTAAVTANRLYWTDQAFAISDRHSDATRVQDVHLYIGGPVRQEARTWLRELGRPAALDPRTDFLREHGDDLTRWRDGLIADGFVDDPPLSDDGRAFKQLFVSEYGFGGLSDIARDLILFGEYTVGRKAESVDVRQYRDFIGRWQAAFRDHGLDERLGSLSDIAILTKKLQAAVVRRQTVAMRVNPAISGYILTQWNDASWEHHAGIVSLWRRPKPAYDAMRAANRLRLAFALPIRRNLYVDETLRLRLYGVNDTPAPQWVDMALSVVEAAPPDVGDAREVSRIGLRYRLEPGIAPRKIVQGEAFTQPGEFFIRFDKVTFEENHDVPDSGLEHESDNPALWPAEPVWVYPRLSVAPPGKMLWLDRAGFDPMEVAFDALDRWAVKPLAAAQPADVVLLARPGAATAATLQRGLALAAGGARLVLLELQPRDRNVLREAGVPFLRWLSERFEPQTYEGDFVGMYHYVLTDPVFAGLPSERIAVDEYQESLPRTTLRYHQGHDRTPTIAQLQPVEGEPAGQPSEEALPPVTDHLAELDRRLRTEWAALVPGGAFRQPEEWYADMLRLPYGRGEVVVCQYRLLSNVGNDPTADRILFNLLDYIRPA